MKRKQNHFSQCQYETGTWWLPRWCTGSWELSLPAPAHSYESHRQIWEWRLPEHFFQRVQQMGQKIKAVSHPGEEQCKEEKLRIFSCAWLFPNTSLPWGLILSCKGAVSVSIIEIKLWIVWFLPGAVICFTLLKSQGSWAELGIRTIKGFLRRYELLLDWHIFQITIFSLREY